MIEVLLPVGYTPGQKPTDLILDNLKWIYGDVVFTHTPTGKYDALIILNSFIPHNHGILNHYPPHKMWYYMYDMDWGSKWYEEFKSSLQLITDKPHLDSRFLIPTGMIALHKLGRPLTGPRAGRICIMESYKQSRIEQYDKYLQSDVLNIDVIGTTMNKRYKHKGNKIRSVPYSELQGLLQDYSYCLILHDEPHNAYNLPLKVAECISAGVIPILVKEYNNPIFPQVDSLQDLLLYISKKFNRGDELARLANHYRGKMDLEQLKRSAQLIETDELYLKELEELLVWGRAKHKGHYWRENLDIKDFIAALKRHLAAYESGEKIDPETGISHLVAIGANAMFKRRIDEQ